MAYEFKKLSDVAAVETPADTANVLIEEDGVIKKAPQTAFGGSGSVGGYVIDITADDFDATDVTYGDTVLELVRNGAHLMVYDGDSYGAVVFVCFGADTSGEAEQPTMIIGHVNQVSTASFSSSITALSLYITANPTTTA